MEVVRVCCVYFSPCGSVEKAVSCMAGHAAKMLEVPIEKYDFTLPSAREGSVAFGEKDLVFFGTPVYAGRVPNKIMPYIKESFSGNGAIAVPVVVYGNRNFDDALVELRNLLTDNGFYTIAAAAIVARHSFSEVIAAGRPNEEDLRDILKFTDKILEKAGKLSSDAALQPVAVPGTNPPEKYYVPLGIDGKPAKFLKAHPETDLEKCDHCGICVKKCPMGSIDEEHPELMAGICIKCQACIRKCPNGAKYFDDEAFLSHKQMLETNCLSRKESGFFIS